MMTRVYWNENENFEILPPSYIISPFSKTEPFEDIAQFIYQVINGSINLRDLGLCIPFLRDYLVHFK